MKPFNTSKVLVHILKHKRPIRNWLATVVVLSTVWSTSYTINYGLNNCMWIIFPTIITAAGILARIIIWWLYKEE